jgi:hypothetical protein
MTAQNRTAKSYPKLKQKMLRTSPIYAQGSILNTTNRISLFPSNPFSGLQLLLVDFYRISHRIQYFFISTLELVELKHNQVLLGFL